MDSDPSSHRTSIPDEDPIQQPSSSTQAYEPKKLKTAEVGSIFDLKNEVLKRRTAVVPNNLSEEYRAGRGAFAVKKEEAKTSEKTEARARKSRIKTLGLELKKEEEERLAVASRKLAEKAALYDKLVGGVVLKTKDDTPVEFMVDFMSKKKDSDECSASDANPARERDAVHYNPDEEQRVYGVSHMKFSSNEVERQREMDALKAMTKQTAEERLKHKATADRRDELKKQKIARMRQRMGLPELKEPTPPPEPVLTEIPLPELATPSDSLEEQMAKRLRSDREWDRGKDKFNRWIETEREDRNDEFRPPDSYYK